MNRPTARCRRGALTAAACATTLAVPAFALAASGRDRKIPDDYYSPIEASGIPRSPADVQFSLRKHSELTQLSLGCKPSAKTKRRLPKDDGAEIAIVPTKTVKLNASGDFSYDGRAKVESATSKTVERATLSLRGDYVPHGKHYRVVEPGDVTATVVLTFKGTAKSPACTTAGERTFRAYEDGATSD